MIKETLARVFVGTYAKYSSGSLRGAWLELDEYADLDEFLTGCKALHSDESDPELMFQDYEGIPSVWCVESYFVGGLFDFISLCETEREIVRAYVEHNGAPSDISSSITSALEHYCGSFPDHEEFLLEELAQYGWDFSESPLSLICVDWDRTWDAVWSHDYFEEDGHYFRRY
tara:strand:- start:1258 stop:1773 length:516 start_codon:yes stop_codon:yes gene_type:complete